MAESKEEYYESLNYMMLNTLPAIIDYLNSNTTNYFTWDTETTGLDDTDRIVGMSMSVKEGSAIYIPLTHDVDRELNLQDVEGLRKFMAEYCKTKTAIFFNAKFDLNCILREGYTMPMYEDCMNSVFLENSNSKKKGLKFSVKKFLDIEMIELSEVFNVNYEKFSDISPEMGYLYASGDADMTLRLHNHLAYVREEQKLIYHIETKLVDVVRRMENNKMEMNPEYLYRMYLDLKSKIEKAEKGIYEYVGYEFDINSSDVLGELIYETLKIVDLKVLSEEDKKKYLTDKNKYATDAEVLNQIKHPLCTMIVDYRSLIKFQNTYVTRLIASIENGVFIKFKLNQTAAPTGRFSSGKDEGSDEGAMMNDISYAKVNIQSIPANKEKKYLSARILCRKDKATGEVLYKEEPCVLDSYTLEDIHIAVKPKGRKRK